ncbi:unnamed protein product [Caenorhabditis angaria]|uniref:Alpha-methylacyl-CoA racemase n=1 Tax=Caenorhabditis angaria TaxID=860376 RepID=A0A9P1J1D5_9PELO|nr:unnamed protein product [Caenorhabditis angaria]
MQKLLAGIKVVELAGLAPVPYCGLILADFGADVTVVDKKDSSHEQRLNRGKQLKELNLRDPADLKKIREMCRTSDVLLDPFRPGVLEKAGLDPSSLLEENKSLIICRISGYGQTGRMNQDAGHDINYVSMSGMLPTFTGKQASRPWPPANMLADFAGGSLTAAFGIVSAIHARSKNGGEGCVIDCSMTEGVAYIASFIQHYHDQDFMFSDEFSLFSGNCPIYRTYKTKDSKFVAVGCIEPKFHQNMFEVLQIDGSDLFTNPGGMVKQLEDIFLTKTRNEWETVFEGKECCVTPVLDIDEIGSHGLHKDRNNFEKSEKYGGTWIAKPAPKIQTLEDLRKSKSKSKL